ncbi:class I SAM-dependent methyltransferase [Streptomyces luridiscabiei]|uniref:class I SAM-dependent methyltransferase n=1 Tax=Streptomyces luridiscabiei TaxID=164114 RepID=UPI000A7C232E
MSTPYPFTAIVGQDDLRLGLLLNAVSPAVGGVLVRGEKGTAKSTAVRALAALMPEVSVVPGCRFSCDPGSPDPACPDGPHADAAGVSRAARTVELPVGASEDRLVGALDIERALSEGVKAFEPGLLADAHRGILYVDEVNLLHDHLVDLLLDAAGVGEGTRLLEIGTGWGELAVRAAARGARVVSVTLSAEQRQLARTRIREAGFEDRAEVRLCDYRQVTGEYDAIVSVEMIEAVGEEFWPVYFRTLDRLLAPGGRVALQAITMPDDRLRASRSTYTWIHKYIFPGGLLPSTEAIERVTTEHTRLRTVQRIGYGAHYAETLRLWRERFTERSAEVDALGFDAVFRRMWTFYLAYSEAGFRSGYLDVQQLLLTREPTHQENR